MVPTKLLEPKVEAPHIVEVPPNAKTVTIDVRTELRNVSEHDYVVHASSEDQEIFWQVLDKNHREVLRETRKGKGGSRKKSDVHPVRGQTIASGHSTHETETLTLNADKLKDGHTYTIRAEIWGQITETTFIAVRHPDKPAPKKKSTAARKSAKAAKK